MYGISRNQTPDVYIQVDMYIYNLHVLYYRGLTHLRSKINHSSAVFLIYNLDC